MKNFSLFLVLFLIGFSSFCQKEGQGFCNEFDSKDYFPLTIKKKKIHWLDAHYFENITDSQSINGKTYIKFEQVWEQGNVQTLHLREQDGVVYQYEECCDSETIRFDPRFEVGYSWKTASGAAIYKIESVDAKLKTPFCDYENLLVISADLVNGDYKFYYKKGYGYVGATNHEGNLISCVSPDWN